MNDPCERKAMPLLNYTTKVNAQKTVTEVLDRAFWYAP